MQVPEVRERESRERPVILAVLPHFGSGERSLEAARALRASRGVDCRVFLVDNDGGLPEEGLPEGVVVDRPGRNLGFCEAVNRGLREAAAGGIPYLCLANDDALPDPDCLRALATALEGDEDLAGVGPLLTCEGGTRIWSAGAFFRFGPNLVRHALAGRPIEEAPGRPLSVGYLPGALALYRRSDLESLGGLDEGYFMYYEDADLGRRLRARGRGLVLLPWARAAHEGSLASGGGASPLRKYLMGVNVWRFLRRQGRPADWLAFLCCDLLPWLPALPLFLADGRRLRAHLSKGRGLVRGFFGGGVGPEDVARILEGRGA